MDEYGSREAIQALWINKDPIKSSPPSCIPVTAGTKWKEGPYVEGHED